MSIKYSDGDAIEYQILDILRNEKDPSSFNHIAYDKYCYSWPIRYHLSPERSNLLRHFVFSDLDVLEIGAGMGAVSRYLAEHARSLTVVEGTQIRFNCLSERLRDLNNWSGKVGNIQNVNFDHKFDVVCIFGVLEYSELFIKAPSEYSGSPFNLFLEKAAAFLKHDGVLILAIENKFGLKYWSGAAEDHSGKLFDSITSYSLARSAKTFSRKELRSLLEQTSLLSIDEFYPFPDYKVPSSVLSRSFVEQFPQVAAEIAAKSPFEDYGASRPVFFPEHLALLNLAKADLLDEFSNSFLFVAARSPYSSAREYILTRMLKYHELAWHYSLLERKIPTETIFKVEPSAEINVKKRPLFNKESNTPFKFTFENYTVRQNLELNEKLVTGDKLRFILANWAYYNNWDNFLAELKTFIAWSFRKWSLPEGDKDAIRGEALDSIFINAAFVEEDYELFDIEWLLETPLPKSWFIFRNIFALSKDQMMFSSDAPFSSFKQLYELLCKDLSVKPDFELDLSREGEFQGAVTIHTPDSAKRSIIHSLNRGFQASKWVRDSYFETVERSEFNKLIRQKDDQILAILNTWSWKITAPLRWLGRLILKTRNTER